MRTKATAFAAGVAGLALSDVGMYLRMMDIGGAANQASVFWIGSLGALIGYGGWILWLSATLKARTGAVGRGVLFDGLLLGLSAASVFGTLVVLPQIHATGANLDQIWFLGCLMADAVIVWLALSVLVTKPESRQGQLTMLGLALHIGVDVLHSSSAGPATYWQMRIAEGMLVAVFVIWIGALRANDGHGRAPSAVRRVAGLRGTGLVVAMAVPGLLLGTRLWNAEADTAGLLIGAVVLLALLGTVRIRQLLAALSESNAKLAYQAHHDHLTGVWNRSALNDFVQDGAARQAMRAVLYLDLDRFKAVNDTFGHDAGDHVLVQVAERTRAATRGSDRVARVGGDEFVVVVSDTDTDIEAFVSRLGRVLNSEPFLWEGHQLDVGVSVGVARADKSLTGSNVEAFLDLLTEADAAMLASKKDRRGESGRPADVAMAH